MRKKRRAAKVNKDEQTKEVSDLFQQQENNAKRAKLSPGPLSVGPLTTLQDLPIPLLKDVLVKAVTMEVKGMKLVKSVWKEKADLVINRLVNECLHWSSILSTNEFLTEVHSILDDTAEETIRLEILHQSFTDYAVLKVTTMKEEIFMICVQQHPSDVNLYGRVVNVYDRNNMAEVKDVIAVPGKWPRDIKGCNVSNCVYVLCINWESACDSVLRITKDEEHQFNILPFVSGLEPSVFSICLSVFPNGNVCVALGDDPVALSIYNANGSLVSSADIHGFKCVDRVIQKSNGNLVLASINGKRCKRVLTEIDADGKTQRQYVSSLGAGSSVNVADRHGRIVIVKPLSEIELLDSELNLLDFPRQYLGEFMNLHELHYNSERNEVMSVRFVDVESTFLTTFRFTEE